LQRKNEFLKHFANGKSYKSNKVKKTEKVAKNRKEKRKQRKYIYNSLVQSYTLKENICTWWSTLFSDGSE
jgi:hypothetical protein